MRTKTGLALVWASLATFAVQAAADSPSEVPEIPEIFSQSKTKCTKRRTRTPQTVTETVTETLCPNTSQFITVTEPEVTLTISGDEVITTPTITVSDSECIESSAATVTVEGETVTVTAAGEGETVFVTVPGDEEIVTITAAGEEETVTVTVAGEDETVTVTAAGEVETETETITVPVEVEVVSTTTTTETETETEISLSTVIVTQVSTTTTTATETVTHTINTPPTVNICTRTDNIVPNGDFQSELDGNWSFTPQGSDVTMGRVQVTSANYAFRSRIGGSNSGGPQRVSQRFPVCKGARYRASFDARKSAGQGLALAQIYIDNRYMGGSTITSSVSGPVQMIENGDFTASGDTATVEIALTWQAGTRGTRELQVDNVSLVRIS